MHRRNAHEWTVNPQRKRARVDYTIGGVWRPRCQPSQLAELAAGALLAGELGVEEDESDEDEPAEFDDSFVELDDDSLFEESDEEETVLEPLARESVA